jgi:hypothetical protein
MSEEWQHASWVSTLGKLAWIFGLINGIIDLVWGIGFLAYWFPIYSISPYLSFGLGIYVWNIIGGIIMILLSLIIIRPKFSKPCGNKDWDALYNWTLKLGSLRLPWMLIWGVVFAIFSWYYWAAVFILLPAIMLLFVGPKKYDWSA